MSTASISLARIRLGTLLLFAAASASAQHEDHSHHAHAPQAAQSATTSAHIPPDPPTHVMGPMSNEEMADIMAMDDAAPYGSIVLDRVEWRERDDALAWEGSAWYGGDYNKLVMKTEGESGDADHFRTELFWDRVISSWWSMQMGARHDSGDGPSRTWAAIGVEGLAPYWIDLEAAFYVGDGGRTALRMEASYDLRLTQRLILQPQMEANLYGKDDPDRGIGSGLSDLQAALRLRYEIRREFAPFIGVHWSGLFGETADMAKAGGRDDDELQFVAGLRVWF